MRCYRAGMNHDYGHQGGRVSLLSTTATWDINDHGIRHTYFDLDSGPSCPTWALVAPL